MRKQQVERTDPGVEDSWVQILAQPLTSCAPLGGLTCVHLGFFVVLLGRNSTDPWASVRAWCCQAGWGPGISPLADDGAWGQ